MLTRPQKLQGKFLYEETNRRLMDEKHVVSVWIGNADSEKDLLEYLEEDYSDLEAGFEGLAENEDPYGFDFAINLFGLDFGFGSYDHDFSACEFFEPTSSVEFIASYLYLPFPSLGGEF